MNKTILTVKPMRTTNTTSGNPRKAMEMVKTIITDEDMTSVTMFATLNYEDYIQMIGFLDIQYDAMVKMSESDITVSEFNHIKRNSMND